MEERTEDLVSVQQQAHMAAPGEVYFEHLSPQRFGRQVSENGLEGRRLVRLTDV